MTNFSYLILGTVFGFSFVRILTFFHWKTIWQHRKLLGLINLSVLIYWYLADYIGYTMNFWNVSRSKSIGIWIGPVPLEDIIFGLVGSYVVPIVVILMKENYHQGKSLRQILFKKEIRNSN